MAKVDFGKKLLSTTDKRKKNALIIGLILTVTVGLFFSIFSSIDMESAIKAATKRPHELPAVTDIQEEAETKESWAINIENTIDNLEEDQKRTVEEMGAQTKQDIIEANKFMMREIHRDNKKLSTQMEAIANENKKLKAKLEEADARTKNLLGGLKREFQVQIDSAKEMIEEQGVLLPPPLEGTGGAPVSRGEDLFEQIKIIATGGSRDPGGEAQSSGRSVKYYSSSYTNIFPDVNLSAGDEVPLTPEELAKLNTYELMIGFTEAYMVTGAYAPLFSGSQNGGGSGGQNGKSGGQTNVPVLLEATGDMIMPNDIIGAVDKCMLIGTSTGNASSSTIDIRLDKMTCLVNDGKQVLDGKISGWVISETGTPGLPSTMIYRAGEYISRVIGSGVLEGLSQGFINAAAGYNTDSTSAGGTMYNGAVTGAGAGVSNAFSKLADFYLSLAEATLPTLEAKGGRFVTLMLTGGNKFTLRDINLLDTREVDGYVDDLIGD